MKNVFSNSELAHVYANQSQPTGRNSNGSFYFEDKTIFSYGRHFPIAAIVNNSQGVEAMLFTFRTYSNTTSKQISIVNSATRQYNKIYCFNPNYSHEANFIEWVNLAEMEAFKLRKAKKPEIYLNQLGRLSNQVNTYANYFGIKIPATLQAVLSIKDKKENLEYMSKKEELIKIENAIKQKAQKIEYKEKLKKWFNFETGRVYSGLNLDFLRVNQNRVETTQAVQIPIELAKRLHNKIKANTLEVGEQLLGYRVDQVDDIIKIGCHNFKRSYLLNFGSKLA
jgi:transcription elongation GreA/GreB family factor